MIKSNRIQAEAQISNDKFLISRIVAHITTIGIIENEFDNQEYTIPRKMPSRLVFSFGFLKYPAVFFAERRAHLPPSEEVPLAFSH